MTDTSTSSNNACTYTRHFLSEISPFRQASSVPSSMPAGIGVLIVVTAAVKFSNASFNIAALWGHSSKASTIGRRFFLDRAPDYQDRLLIILLFSVLGGKQPKAPPW